MAEEVMRHCYVCQQYKPQSAFQTDRSRICKVMSRCRDCNRVLYKARRKRAKVRRVLASLGLTI